MTTPRTLHVTALILVLSTASTAWGQSVGSASGAVLPGRIGPGRRLQHCATAQCFRRGLVGLVPLLSFLRHDRESFGNSTLLPAALWRIAIQSSDRNSRVDAPAEVRPRDRSAFAASRPDPGGPAGSAEGARAERATRARRASLTLGDRMFRIDDWKRAEDRYQQAARLDPGAAAPRVGLAQIAIVRERYREAADRFREAETARAGLDRHAHDVQAIYAEPADFTKQLAKLQSHLHAASRRSRRLARPWRRVVPLGPRGPGG